MLGRTMRPASLTVAPRLRWLWQHCLDTQHTTTHSRTFALRVRTTDARFPSQPRSTPAPSPTPTTSPPSHTRPARLFAPSTTSTPHTDTTATSSSAAQLALIDAETAHQPDAVLQLLTLVDRQPLPPTPISAPHSSQWTVQLSSATTFDAALLSFAHNEQWSLLLSLYLTHLFHAPLPHITFIPSTAASQLAIEAAMELRDWDRVLRVHVRTVVYQQRRQQRGDSSTAVSATAASKSTRSTKRVDRTAAASAASAAYRTHACLDCVLYSAYRLSRHDIVLSLFDVRSTPLASSHTTYILSCAQVQQWQRVELWLASVDEAVWEEVEMAAVSTVMTAWRTALNQLQQRTQQQQADEQHRYTRCVALVAEWMMRVGSLSTPPLPVQWSADFRVQRTSDGRYSELPLLVRPMVGYVSPLLVSSLSTTTHYSEVDNMAAIITLTLLRMRSHLLSSSSSSSSSATTPLPLFSVYIQPPHSSLTSWDVDAFVDSLSIRGMSAFIRASEMRAVLGGSESRKADEVRRREESRELFESKGERRRRRVEEEAVVRGEMDEEKQWVLEIDVVTMQRWMDRTMLSWERDMLSTQ